MEHIRPEDLRLIADLFKRWIPPNHDKRSIDQIKEDQAALLPMLRVSKHFYHHCAPALYADCLVDDLPRFLFQSGRETGRTLQQVQRLRIIHPDHRGVPTYLHLIASQVWDEIDNPDYQDQFSVAREAVELVDIGQRLLKMCPKHPILPRVERIAMAGTRDRKSEEYTNEFQYEGPLPHSLPHALVGWSTVRHYCQSTLAGPLALPNGFISVHPEFETFTHHVLPGQRPSSVPGHVLPVVIGAINRYYFPCNHIITSYDGLRPSATGAQLTRLFNLFRSMTLQAIAVPARAGVCAEDIYDIAPEGIRRTSIEIYDYIRHVRVYDPEPSTTFPFLAMNYFGLAERPPESLKVVQSALDQFLGGEWKGRVIFKNREEAPICAACDMDVQEHWKSVEAKRVAAADPALLSPLGGHPVHR